jgi:hypothetical protein
VKDDDLTVAAAVLSYGRLALNFVSNNERGIVMTGLASGDTLSFNLTAHLFAPGASGSTTNMYSLPMRSGSQVALVYSSSVGENSAVMQLCDVVGDSCVSLSLSYLFHGSFLILVCCRADQILTGAPVIWTQKATCMAAVKLSESSLAGTHISGGK